MEITNLTNAIHDLLTGLITSYQHLAMVGVGLTVGIMFISNLRRSRADVKRQMSNR